MEIIEQIERRLSEGADQLRANSKLTSTEYDMLVLGLIFLRHPFNQFLVVKEEVEKNLPKKEKSQLWRADFLDTIEKISG
jgi:type I restriction enzyme M protein